MPKPKRLPSTSSDLSAKRTNAPRKKEAVEVAINLPANLPDDRPATNDRSIGDAPFEVDKSNDPIPSNATNPSAPSRVLIVHSDPALLRLVRESLEAFLHCEVRTTSSGLAAFDRILQESYRLLLIDLHIPELGGELLYDLISRTYPKVHPGALTAPAVCWIGTPADHPRQDELTREARTKALLLTPLNIQRLLTTAASLLPGKI